MRVRAVRGLARPAGRWKGSPRTQVFEAPSGGSAGVRAPGGCGVGCSGFEWAARRGLGPERHIKATAKCPCWSGTPRSPPCAAWDGASEGPWNLEESGHVGGGFVLGNPIKGQSDLDENLGDGGTGGCRWPWHDPSQEASQEGGGARSPAAVTRSRPPPPARVTVGTRRPALPGPLSL